MVYALVGGILFFLLTKLVASGIKQQKRKLYSLAGEGIMAKRRRINKVYRTNKDTISLNVEQFSAELGLFPYAEQWGGEQRHWWSPSTDPRRLRKKGSQISK